jgi:uncharacterized membrane protein YiaA
MFTITSWLIIFGGVVCLGVGVVNYIYKDSLQLNERQDEED